MTAAPRDLVGIALHWMQAAASGKGIRLDADEVDLLNAAGVGEAITALAATAQREQCLNRSARTRSINGEHIDSTPAPVEGTSKLSGTTSPQDASEAAARALAMCQPGARPSTAFISNRKRADKSAQHAGKSVEQRTASS